MTTSLGNPFTNLVILAASEPERTLRRFHPVFVQERPTHDSDNGVGDGAKEDMSKFVRHDIAQPRSVTLADEYDGAGPQGDSAAD